jgi:hypothetical protein
MKTSLQESTAKIQELELQIQRGRRDTTMVLRENKRRDERIEELMQHIYAMEHGARQNLKVALDMLNEEKGLIALVRHVAGKNLPFNTFD